jgi:hypothetical protein
MVVLDQHEYLCAEEKRLKEDRERTRYWKRWGPYVAERQWATGSLNLLLIDLSFFIWGDMLGKEALGIACANDLISVLE